MPPAHPQAWVFLSPGPASILSLPVVRTAWWVLTRGREGREGCWVEAAENVLSLGLGHHEDRRGPGAMVGHGWGAQKVGCSSLGLQRPSAVMQGRERFGAWVGLPCRVSQRTGGPMNTGLKHDSEHYLPRTRLPCLCALLMPFWTTALNSPTPWCVQ